MGSFRDYYEDLDYPPARVDTASRLSWRHLVAWLRDRTHTWLGRGGRAILAVWRTARRAVQRKPPR